MCQSSLFYIRTLKDYMIYMAGSRSEVYRYMRYMYRSKLQVKPVNGTYWLAEDFGVMAIPTQQT